PAAAGRHDLVAVEAETGDLAQCAHRSAPVARPEAFGGVLDRPEVVRARQLQDRIEVRRMAERIDRHDGANPAACRPVARGAVAPDGLVLEEVGELDRIELPVLAFDVDKY